MSDPAGELEGLLETIREGNVPDPDVLLEMDATIRQNREAFTRDDLRGLLGLVGQVQQALEAEQQAVRAELDKLAGERRAIRGYAQLRSRRKAQRLNRKT